MADKFPLDPKPCPFCGHHGTLNLVGVPLTDKSVALQFECVCGAMGPSVSMDKAEAGTQAGWTKAAEKWNKRRKTKNDQ